MEPFVRSFVLGVSSGALLEAGHLALQCLTGSFPGVAHFSPLLVADHAAALAAWVCLYCVEVAAIMGVLRRFNWDHAAAAPDLRRLMTLPKRMAPNLRMALFRRLFLAGTKLAAANSAGGAAPADAASGSLLASAGSSDGNVATALAASVGAVSTAPPPPLPRATHPVGGNTILPAPPSLRRGGGGGGAVEAPPAQRQADSEAARAAKRAKELRDRSGYLRNFWYAAALSERLGSEPLRVQLAGREMVLFRGRDGAVRCVDNICPHRGAPLSKGWVADVEGHTCVVCPYHGWALDGEGVLRDVPAAEHKGEWPHRALAESYAVEEKGGFIWLFLGSSALPPSQRPPISDIPELHHPEWKAVYEELEFEANHFPVFENAFDFAHIHYLHAGSFGNQGKPEVKNMQAMTDAYGVTTHFDIFNKPVNAFWALFQTPVVHVTARAMLPSTSVVSFTLGNGLSFITFVNAVPLSARKTVVRFALIRNLAWEKSGLFNSRLWDGVARRAMIKILTEDKAMVERLAYGQLPAEYSVGADLAQVKFRQLRQQFVDLGYGLPTEEEAPPFACSPSRSSACDSSGGGTPGQPGTAAGSPHY